MRSQVANWSGKNYLTPQRKKPSARYADIHRKRPCMWQCSVPGGYVLMITEVSNYWLIINQWYNSIRRLAWGTSPLRSGLRWRGALCEVWGSPKKGPEKNVVHLGTIAAHIETVTCCLFRLERCLDHHIPKSHKPTRKNRGFVASPMRNDWTKSHQKNLAAVRGEFVDFPCPFGQVSSRSSEGDSN